MKGGYTTYNVHNLLRIISTVHFLPSQFEVPGNNQEDYNMCIKEVEDIKINGTKYRKAGLKFYGGDDSVYFDSFSNIYPFKVLVKNLNNKTELYYTRKDLIEKIFYNICSISFLFFIVKLLQRSISIVHSAALYKNGESHLISAWSETGKSFTTMKLINMGFKLVSDDTILVSSKGEVYPFTEGLSIYPGILDAIKIDLPLYKRIISKIKLSITKIPPFNIYVYPNIRISPEKVGGIMEYSNIGKVFILERGEREIRDIDHNKAVNKIFSTTLDVLTSIPSFPRRLWYAYCYLNDFPANFIENRILEILRESLREKECILIREKNIKNFADIIAKNV